MFAVNPYLFTYIYSLHGKSTICIHSWRSFHIVYNAEYADNTEKYAYYDNKQDERIHIVYKNKKFALQQRLNILSQIIMYYQTMVRQYETTSTKECKNVDLPCKL